MNPKLEAQSPVTREMAVEAAQRLRRDLDETFEHPPGELYNSSPDIVTVHDYLAQSPPLASMTGGRVDGEVLEAAVNEAFVMDYDNIPGKGPLMLFRKLDDGMMTLATPDHVVEFVRSILSGRGADDSEEAVKHDGPYIEVPRTVIDRKYNPDYGDKKVCECGHIYSRHFDNYEDMADVGCKYCGCSNFNPMPNPLPGIELNREGK